MLKSRIAISILIILFIIISSSISFAENYFVDSRYGNDNNSGTSSNNPWKTISKVNSVNFLPGDKILFKKGEIWEGTGLKIKDKGIEDNRIIFGAYGTGEKPIISLRSSIPGWNNKGNWTKASGDTIWMINFPGISISNGKRITRMWLSNVEYATAKEHYKYGDNLDNLDGGETTYGVNRIHRFLANRSGQIFLWTNGSNPADFYSDIEYSGVITSDGSTEYFAVTLVDADYVTIENLEVQGGMYSAIGMQGSDFVIIDNCSIGKYSKQAGFVANSGFYLGSEDMTSDYGELKNSVIESDYKVKFYYQYGDEVLCAYGVSLSNGASHWKVHHNIVTGYANHLFTNSDESPALHNEFYNNEVHYKEGTYGKAGQVNGIGENAYTYTKYYNNYFHDLPSGLSICGAGVTVAYNIFENITEATNEHASSLNSGYGLQIMTPGVNPGSYVDSTFVYNNTFINLLHSPIFFTKNNGWFENNLFLNCRPEAPAKIYIRTSGGSEDRINNNLFFSNGSQETDKFIYWSFQNLFFSILEFNSLPESKKNETNDNLIHIGILNDIINNNDFSLTSGSPAINTGIERPWMQKTDYYGNPIKDKRDIGAVEFTGLEKNSNTEETKPLEFRLEQNYPNPFNPVTSINYSIPQSTFVSLKIYNMLGKEVAVLVNEIQNEGYYTIPFTGLNLASGHYFYRLQMGNNIITKKMTLLK